MIKAKDFSFSQSGFLKGTRHFSDLRVELRISNVKEIFCLFYNLVHQSFEFCVLFRSCSYTNFCIHVYRKILNCFRVKGSYVKEKENKLKISGRRVHSYRKWNSQIIVILSLQEVNVDLIVDVLDPCLKIEMP